MTEIVKNRIVSYIDRRIEGGGCANGINLGTKPKVLKIREMITSGKGESSIIEFIDKCIDIQINEGDKCFNLPLIDEMHRLKMLIQ
jgi:hypothetical protein